MEQEVLEVKALIDQLRATDTQLRVFGASSHRYRIGARLSPSDVRAFESKHSITVPEDFRLYLQLVGDGNGEPWRERTGPWQRGGAGPGYGLYPLAETVYGDRVNRLFPFEEKVELSGEPPFHDWEWGVPGALEICTHGCVSHSHLIAVGPERGTIWEGFEYDHFAPTRLSFSQWMRAWAERELQVLGGKRLVEQIRIGMTRAQVLALTGEGWRESDAAGTTLWGNASLRVQLTLDEQKIVTKISGLS